MEEFFASASPSTVIARCLERNPAGDGIYEVVEGGQLEVHQGISLVDERDKHLMSSLEVDVSRDCHVSSIWTQEDGREVFAIWDVHNNVTYNPETDEVTYTYPAKNWGSGKGWLPKNPQG